MHILQSIERSCVLVVFLGLGGCGEPVFSPAEPTTSSAIPNLTASNQSTSSPTSLNPDGKQAVTAIKLEEAEQKSTKPRSADDPVAVTFRVSKNAIGPGDTLEISVEFEIGSSYEIHDRHAVAPAISTTVEMVLPTGFESDENWSDPTPVRSDLPDGHSVYVGKIAFTRQIRIGDGITAGQHSLGCLFQYQACNARHCLRPVEGKLQLSLISYSR
ncbi:MAG: hypothetical protein ABL921_34745 [Pirellula sp.]